MDITTIIYRGVGHGDWVDCHNCERTMLVTFVPQTEKVSVR